MFGTTVDKLEMHVVEYSGLYRQLASLVGGAVLMLCNLNTEDRGRADTTIYLNVVSTAS